MRFFAMRYTLIGILLMCVVQTYAQILPTYADVNYAGDEIKRHLLDVYMPPDEEDPRPAVMYIHGGGWETGEKRGELRNELRKIYEIAKYVVVDINYRYSTDSIWPAQLYDCKAAIRYLRHHAELYNIDTCAIGVMGHSSGGHLAATLGTTNDIDSLEGYHIGYPHHSSSVQAVINFFGPTDFLKAEAHFPLTPPDSCIETATYDQPWSSVSQLVGCHISTCPKTVATANPITYINGDEPPFRIYHGTFDCIVPLHQSEILYQSLIEENIPTDFIVVQNAVHADPVFYGTAATNGIANFFIEHLSKAACFEPPIVITNNDTISEHTFTLVPNPAQDIITLNFHLQATPQYLEIINLNGQHLSTHNDTSINIQHLPKGIYFIRVVFQDSSITKRFVKL